MVVNTYGQKHGHPCLLSFRDFTNFLLQESLYSRHFLKKEIRFLKVGINKLMENASAFHTMPRIIKKGL